VAAFIRPLGCPDESGQYERVHPLENLKKIQKNSKNSRTKAYLRLAYCALEEPSANDECLMTNDERMTNDKCLMETRSSSLDIRSAPMTNA
jgi:hypothetical protein